MASATAAVPHGQVVVHSQPLGHDARWSGALLEHSTGCHGVGGEKVTALFCVVSLPVPFLWWHGTCSCYVVGSWSLTWQQTLLFYMPISICFCSAFISALFMAHTASTQLKWTTQQTAIAYHTHNLASDHIDRYLARCLREDLGPCRLGKVLDLEVGSQVYRPDVSTDGCCLL
jgi:hypothetical protein